MNTVYTSETGVRPWESIYPTHDAGFITVTLIDHDFASLWESWCDLMEPISEEWPIKKIWYSAMTSGFSSKAQEYLFKKHATKTLKDQDLCKKNEKSNIYSTIKNQPKNPREIEKFTFEASHDTLLVIQKVETKTDELWSEMTLFEKQITPEKIISFLLLQGNILLCRFYEAETHAAAQLIYQTNHENTAILESVNTLFKKINPEDVHHYINNTKTL